jgi:EAL domain-containing protein (putative c-di-GMP-specific phosphodiesterase class I)
MGCDQYQGFHFSPPLSAADFGALMRRREQPEDSLGEFESRQARL